MIKIIIGPMKDQFTFIKMPQHQDIPIVRQTIASWSHIIVDDAHYNDCCWTTKRQRRVSVSLSAKRT